MKTVDLPKASPEVANLLDQARRDDLFVRLGDGSQFLLIAVVDFEAEMQKTRDNPKLMALLDERAKQTDTVPLDEVKRRLGI